MRQNLVLLETDLHPGTSTPDGIIRSVDNGWIEIEGQSVMYRVLTIPNVQKTELFRTSFPVAPVCVGCD